MNTKTLTITNVVLIIAVIILFVMQLAGGKNVQEKELEVKNPLATDSLEVKEDVEVVKKFNVAFVNSDTVTTYYEFSREMTAKLQEKQTSAERKLKGLYSKYEKQRKSFEEQAPIMGQQELQRKAQEIGLLEQSILQKEQELSASLAKKEAEVMSDYVYETDRFMQVIGKELGYDYVLSYRVGGPMLYANPELDITDKVIELLNQEYKKSKATEQPSVEK
ncbi:MAG: OmpH family outer membrane protein [Flavobacteriales bacterium]|jgi:outer membrane protein|nr:OmpH family outer membrane protein [Flavobacteriales bacterium]